MGRRLGNSAEGVGMERDGPQGELLKDAGKALAWISETVGDAR